MADDRDVSEHCVHCLKPLADRDGYENSLGETLCDACYGELWKRKADQPAQSLVESAMQALRVSRRSLA